MEEFELFVVDEDGHEDIYFEPASLEAALQYGSPLHGVIFHNYTENDHSITTHVQDWWHPAQARFVPLWDHLEEVQEGVRLWAAGRENAPVAALLFLAKDPVHHVRMEVAAHGRTPASILEELSKDSVASVRNMVALNRNTPAHILDALSSDVSSSVRNKVATSKRTPTETLKKMLSDPEEKIQNTARKRLVMRGEMV